MPPPPSRGEIWLVNLNPTRGHEQAGTRPAVVVSTDMFNRGPADLVIVIPLTTRARGTPFHVEVKPPEGGVRERSFIKCEDIRSVSRERLIGPSWGVLSDQTLGAVAEILRILLEL